jgi:hypothetical protein
MRSNFWLEIVKGTDHSEDLDVGGSIILKCTQWKLGGTVWS